MYDHKNAPISPRTWTSNPDPNVKHVAAIKLGVSMSWDEVQHSYYCLCIPSNCQHVLLNNSFLSYNIPSDLLCRVWICSPLLADFIQSACLTSWGWPQACFPQLGTKVTNPHPRSNQWFNGSQVLLKPSHHVTLCDSYILVPTIFTLSYKTWL